MFVKIVYGSKESKDLYLTGVIADDARLYWKGADVCRILNTHHKYVYRNICRYVEGKIFRLCDVVDWHKQHTIVLSHEQVCQYAKRVSSLRRYNVADFMDWFLDINAGIAPLYQHGNQLKAKIRNTKDYFFFKRRMDETYYNQSFIPDILEIFKTKFLKRKSAPAEIERPSGGGGGGSDDGDIFEPMEPMEPMVVLEETVVQTDDDGEETQFLNATLLDDAWKEGRLVIDESPQQQQQQPDDRLSIDMSVLDDGQQPTRDESQSVAQRDPSATESGDGGGGSSSNSDSSILYNLLQGQRQSFPSLWSDIRFEWIRRQDLEVMCQRPTAEDGKETILSNLTPSKNFFCKYRNGKTYKYIAIDWDDSKMMPLKPFVKKYPEENKSYLFIPFEK